MLNSYTAESEVRITYVMYGLLSTTPLNAKTVDYVVTGYGTGEGAVLAFNTFPGVLYGHIVDSEDAYMFAQINDGNTITFPFAKGSGWSVELKLQYIFEKLFGCESGGGYPKKQVVPEQRNKKILDNIEEITHKDTMTILKAIDQEVLKAAVSGEELQGYFFKNYQTKGIAKYLKGVLRR